MELNFANVGLLLTFSSCMVGFLTYALTKKKDEKKEIKDDTTTQTELKMQLEYISRGIDDIKLEMRDIRLNAKTQDNKINELTVKCATLEASLKSEHKRLNELEQRLTESERK